MKRERLKKGLKFSGQELCSGCDMRFGLAGKTKFNQMEVPLGILPGGNGTVNFSKKISCCEAASHRRLIPWHLGYIGISYHMCLTRPTSSSTPPGVPYRLDTRCRESGSFLALYELNYFVV